MNIEVQAIATTFFVIGISEVEMSYNLLWFMVVIWVDNLPHSDSIDTHLNSV